MSEEKITNAETQELEPEKMDQVAGGKVEYRDGNAVCIYCGSTHTEKTYASMTGRYFECQDCGNCFWDYGAFSDFRDA
jgi:hypothetical protein